MQNLLTTLELASLLIFPHRCLVCRALIRCGDLCRHCRPPRPIIATDCRCYSCFGDIQQWANERLCPTCQQVPSTFNRHRFLWSYREQARDLILAMKYRPSRKLAAHSSHILTEYLPRLFDDGMNWDVIIPMPSSPQNYSYRLFNPARALAEPISRAIGAKLITNALIHSQKSKSQATQHDRERIRNAWRSLRAGSRVLNGESILLIDDVVTTGATGAVAAYLLRRQGAGKLDMLSLARSDSWQRYRRQVSLFTRKMPSR